ncbi:MAG: branched-chain amino acid ABC transporter permease [Burkholderiaceae bacterium]
MSVFVIGLSIGMLLFLLAAGLTLIFGMLGVINFAHGALYMLGAYLAYQLVTWTGSFWVALAISPLIVAAVSAAMEFVAMRPIYTRDHFYQVLLTFGAILVIDEIVRVIWGLQPKLLAAPPGLGGSVHMFGSDVSAYRLFIIVFGAAISALLFFLLERSKYGMVIRACSKDSDMASCLGVNVPRVRTAIFALGAGLAAMGGVVAGPLFPVDTNMGFLVIITCFIVVVVGGLGNIKGSLLGALLIGMVQAYGQRYLPDLIGVLTYVLFIGVLLMRPQGLFSRVLRQS